MSSKSEESEGPFVHKVCNKKLVELKNINAGSHYKDIYVDVVSCKNKAYLDGMYTIVASYNVSFVCFFIMIKSMLLSWLI